MGGDSEKFGKVRGIAFDLDGTLIDSYQAITESLNHALSCAGRESLRLDQVKTMVGHGLETLIARALGSTETAPDTARAVLDFREKYDLICEEMTTLLAGVEPTVRSLHRRGYLMSVATNKPARFARRILDALDVGPLFRTVLGPDVVENKKPHPEMLLRVFREMNLAPADGVYVGDMEVDIRTARAAEIPVIVVPSGSRDREALVGENPDRVLDAFEELLEIFPGLPDRPGEGAGS